MRKILFLATVFFLAGTFSEAQEKNKEKKADFSLEIKSNHLWRGIVVSDVPMAALDLNYAFDKNNYFKLGVWGGLAFAEHKDKHYHEVNLYLKYDTGKFGVGVWDVFNPTDLSGKSAEVLNYNQKITGHRVDIRAYYVLSEKFPLKIEGGPSIFGNDRKQNNDQRLSTYAELSYPVLKNNKIVDINLFCGGAFPLNGGESHFYGNGKHDFDIVNVGFTASKDIKVFNYNLPLSATMVWNPSTDDFRVQVAAKVF